MGSKEDIQAKIDIDTQKKIEEIVTEVANIRGPVNIAQFDNSILSKRMFLCFR